MRTIFTLLLSFTSFIALACSCAPYYSFCEYKSQLNPDIILSAVVLDTNQYGIRLEKLTLLEGVESRDTIRVWNDTNYNCSGTISMRASLIGEVGDTVIVMLPRINSVHTAWGVAGDYRTPVYLCGDAFLKVKNDSLEKAPNTYYDQSTIPPSIETSDIPSYQDFITYYNQFGNCTDLRKGDLKYTPFPESIGTYWTDLEDVNSLQQTYLHQNRISRDTIINGLKYYELKRKTEHTVHHSSGSVSYTNAIYGYFRNDSANKKVWLRFPNANADSLLYDFNLKVGDTIPYTYIFSITSNPTHGKVVDSIGFTTYRDKLHKVYYIADNCEKDSLIEGIGFSAGTYIKDSPCFLGASYNLECVNIASKNYYPDSTYNCDLLTGIEQFDSQKGQIEIYPNPITASFSLYTPFKMRSLSVYDLGGKLIKRLDENLKHHSISLESGAYFLRIEDVNGNVYHEKLVKN